MNEFTAMRQLIDSERGRRDEIGKALLKASELTKAQCEATRRFGRSHDARQAWLQADEMIMLAIRATLAASMLAEVEVPA